MTFIALPSFICLLLSSPSFALIVDYPYEQPNRLIFVYTKATDELIHTHKSTPTLFRNQDNRIRPTER